MSGLTWKSLLPKRRKLRLTRSLMKDRTHELAEIIKRESGMRVMGGPFQGLVLPDAMSWGDLAPKLLGLYESELAGAIDVLVAGAPSRVVNVGCAEGYYAVGLARRLPGTEVIAYDTDPSAQALAALCAKLNGVPLTVRGTCAPEVLAGLAQSEPRLAVVLDCEGFERELLLTTPDAFRNAAMLVECHDTVHPGLTDRIAQAFAATHDVTRIQQGARNPHAIPMLQSWNEADRWLVVSERRAAVMSWLWMQPKA